MPTINRSRITLTVPLLALLLLCPTVVAQNSQPSEDSWHSSSTLQGDNTNPTRTTKQHSQSGNRTVDVQSVQVRGSDGQYVPYQDVETETVQVDANTVRTTTRSFGRGPNGGKILVQVTEEQTHTLPGGGSSLTRAVSNPDANGRLQLVRRDTEETRKISPGVEETNTTTSFPSVNGGFAPTMKVQERRQEGPNNTVETQKTTFLPDGAGKWQVTETRQSVSEIEGQQRSSEEHTAQRDFEGNLGEVSRTVSHESESAPGDKQKTTTTDSIDRPGSTRDGNMHVVERVNTTQQTSDSGQQTTTVVENPDPGDPSGGLQTTSVSSDAERNSASGSESTQTVQAPDSDGKMVVVSKQTTKSTKPPQSQTKAGKPQ